MIEKNKETKAILFNRLRSVINNSDNPEIDDLRPDLSIHKFRNNIELFEETNIIFDKEKEILTEKDKEIKNLQKLVKQRDIDISIMNNKCISQLVKNEELQKQMDKLEIEVEQLSQSLFEEANKLVSEEAMKRYKVEQRNSELETQIRTFESKLEVKNENVYIMDDVELQLFQIFLVNFIKTKPLLSKSSYLKQIMEDINQIIKFTGIKSYKFNELVFSQHIKIKTIYNSKSVEKICEGCKKPVNNNYYEIELDINQKMTLDKYCKEKIETGKNFIEFILDLRDGKYMKKRVDEIYQLFFAFRLKFFYFKCGASIGNINVDFSKSPILDELSLIPDQSSKRFGFGL